ncbi:MAG: DUF2807 domain-containing protein [Fimbriimonadaceae bacterium]|nr:DUF2807 domain-containing protein [Chitinophagales bacterium]
MKQLKTTVLLTLISALIIPASSCRDGKWPCVNGSGESISEVRSVSGFTGVTSEIEATVYVTQGSEFEVRIEAQQNVLDQIRTNVSGNDLEISSERCINNSDPVKIYITMPVVNSLAISGSGSLITQNKITTGDMDIDISGSGEFTSVDSIIASDISMDISGSGNMDLIANAPVLSADISGSGDVTIAGYGSSLDLNISGSGEMHTFNFHVLTSDVKISGSGDLEINAMDKIEGSISGSGDLYYKNSPIINISVSGSGEIIHVD